MAGGDLAPRARRVVPGEGGTELIEWEFARVPDRLWLDLLAGAGLPRDLRVQVNGRRLRLAVDSGDRADAVEVVEKAITEASEQYGVENPPVPECEPDPEGRDLYEADLAEVVRRRHLSLDRRA